MWYPDGNVTHTQSSATHTHSSAVSSNATRTQRRNTHPPMPPTHVHPLPAHSPPACGTQWVSICPLHMVQLPPPSPAPSQPGEGAVGRLGERAGGDGRDNGHCVLGHKLHSVGEDTGKPCWFLLIHHLSGLCSSSPEMKEPSFVYCLSRRSLWNRSRAGALMLIPVNWGGCQANMPAI